MALPGSAARNVFSSKKASSRDFRSPEHAPPSVTGAKVFTVACGAGSCAFRSQKDEPGEAYGMQIQVFVKNG